MKLFDVPSETPPADAGLTCAFGEPWTGPHPLCAARVEQDRAAFQAAVARGEFDAEGYTPKERKAQAQRTANPSN
jgi:hypothetical protein